MATERQYAANGLLIDEQIPTRQFAANGLLINSTAVTGTPISTDRKTRLGLYGGPRTVYKAVEPPPPPTGFIGAWAARKPQTIGMGIN